SSEEARRRGRRALSSLAARADGQGVRICHRASDVDTEPGAAARAWIVKGGLSTIPALRHRQVGHRARVSRASGPSTHGVGTLAPDGWLLFGTRCARLFAYGFLSVVLVLYLSAVGLSDREIGLLLTMALLGDTVISLGLTTTADRIGRRTMLTTG